MALNGTNPCSVRANLGPKPHDPLGNGAMTAFSAGNPAQVNALYDRTIQLTATDEGERGPRLDGFVSCADARDLDGNKLNFFYMGSCNCCSALDRATASLAYANSRDRIDRPQPLWQPREHK